MNNKPLCKLTLLIILCLGSFIKVYSQKPNVIVVVVDDQGYADFGYKGVHQNIRTPNLDAFAKESMEFSNAYVASPICSPSRCALISGRYPARGNNFFYGGDGVEEDIPTMAEQFIQLGYATGYIGKLHYGKNDKLGARGYPDEHGFGYSVTSGVGGRVHYLYHNNEAVKKHSNTAKPWLVNGKELEQDGFSTEMISNWAQDFIQENQTKPFFLQIAFNAVHNFNFQLPEAYLKEWNLPFYPDFQELTTDEKENDWYDRSILPSLPNGREYYIAQLYYLDRQFGKIRYKLKELNLDENTIIIYLSDNGGSHCNGGDNTPLHGTKYSLYEGGVRVPFYMYWKGKVKSGLVCNDIISAMDIMPTVLAAAGAEPSFYNKSDGINLLPYITKGKKIERDVLVWDTGFSWAIRKGDWKLKVVTNQNYADRISKKQHTDLGSGIELFNLASDMEEQHNVAENYPEKVAELTGLYNQWKTEISNTSK